MSKPLPTTQENFIIVTDPTTRGYAGIGISNYIYQLKDESNGSRPYIVTKPRPAAPPSAREARVPESNEWSAYESTRRSGGGRRRGCGRVGRHAVLRGALVGGVALQLRQLVPGGGRGHAPPARAPVYGVLRLLEAGPQPQDDAQRRCVLPVAPRVPILRLLVEPAPLRLRACRSTELA